MKDRCKIPSRKADRTDRPSTYHPEEAKRAALLCFSTVLCTYCDVCRLLCPDLCITRDNERGMIVIDLQYCKGCGLCAHFCPKDAIRMEVEKK